MQEQGNMKNNEDVQEQKSMQKKNKKNIGKWIALSILFLIIGIAATTIALMDRLNGYLMSDAGAIALDLGESIVDEDWKDIKDRFKGIEIEIGEQDKGKEEKDESGDSEDKTEGKSEKQASFQVTDGNAVWGTETQIAIFEIAYEGGEENITVQSSNGDKVIAPGTTQSYTFKVKNTGEVAIDYLVDVDAYVTPSGVALPVDSRLNRYDGEWIVGDHEEYVEIETLDQAEDSGTLGAGKYGYYTLEWVWPFESGDDEYDTLLGNAMAEGENITFTIEIRTVATTSANPNASGGLTSIQTGDDANMPLILAVSAGAVALLFLLLVLKKKNDERISPEAEK